MKILFLLPPSEGKNIGGEYKKEELSFVFDKPTEIANNATEKDLKCKGDRYNEGIELNKKINYGLFDLAINRYSGVMYNAIDYKGMNNIGKEFFEDNFVVFSGMYGIVKPGDKIGNYKLPIETKGLYKFWGDKITNTLNKLNLELIVNLLPGSYTKMLDFKNLNSKIININFLTEKDGKIVKISHGVKKIKGQWIKDICENQITDYNKFGGNVVENENIIDINIKS